MTPLIRRTELLEIIDLRHAILRAGLPKDAAIFPGDELPSSRHYGAFTPNGQSAAAIGCATFHLNQYEGAPAWQLRGMATSNEYRGKGIGRAMLELADSEILANSSSPRQLWCNARTPAIGFYQTLGWTVVSQEFEIPTAGPHVRMVRKIKNP
jgi:predicted GNAT family N-acyltransferase